jgi:hypothetical protein
MKNFDTEIVVYIMSCDATKDVALHFFEAFKKYWPDCPYNIAIGSNTDDGSIYIDKIREIKVLSNKSNWKAESLNQINALKKEYPKVKYVLLMLDDFILNEGVNTSELVNVADAAIKNKLGYIGLKPLSLSIWSKLFLKLKTISLSGVSFFHVPKRYPYYSSLQIALWDVDYLYYMIKNCQNIWDFETIDACDDYGVRPHIATSKIIFKYKHIVEKGEWDIGAEQHCKKAIGYFNEGKRKFKKNIFGAFGRSLSLLRFQVFGFLPMRLKKGLKKLMEKLND